MIISFAEANEILNKYFKPELKIVEVELENSLGYVLAENIHSDCTLPSFDNSSMDGYAIKFVEGRTSWKIIGEITAGNFDEISIDENTAVSIMTGAKMPAGADTIIPIENLIVEDDTITLKEGHSYMFEDNLRKAGEDVEEGEKIFSKGTVIKTNHIPLLAAIGKAKVKVYKPLNIGIMITGDELIDIDKTPKNDEIRATNLYALIALVKSKNMNPMNLGIVNDDYDTLKEAIAKVLEQDIDILLTTGGVSFGKRDYMKEVLEELGIERRFWRTFIKPGKPTYFGTYNKNGKNIAVLGLPGNPLSSFVNFNVTVLPHINRILGVAENNLFKAELTTEYKKKDSKLHFVIAYSEFDLDKNKYIVKVAGMQSSGGMKTLSKANCIIKFYEEKRLLEVGEIVECIWI
jgi:molybdopterin molybdotransferase